MDLDLVPFQTSSTHLSLAPNLTEEEWEKVGRDLGNASQGIQWFIGDWLNYGVDHGYIPQGKYEKAEALTKMSKGWLYECAWVARAIPPSDRRPDLSFTHHRTVASLKPGIERNAILQVAAENSIPIAELRRLASDVMVPTTIVEGAVQQDDTIVVLPDLAPPPSTGDSPVQGEVITLGKHKLIVGDASDRITWDLLFANEPNADVMWTDPPYGVSYVGKTEEALTIQNDSEDDMLKVVTLAFVHADDYLSDGSALYICTGFRLQHIFNEIISQIGWRFSTELVWVKNRFAMGWGDYHPQHESQLYAFKGASRRWYGNRNASTIFGLERDTDGNARFTIPVNQVNEDHPDPKPVKLIFEQLINSGTHGQIVVDPFAGSGSTMIAAEQLGMRAFMIELEPKYAQVIIDRYHREIESAAG